MRSFYSMDVDPRGFATPGSYFSVGTHSPLQTTIAPDSSRGGYAGWGTPGKRLLNPVTTGAKGAGWDRSMAQYAYPQGYPKYAGLGRFPGGESVGGGNTSVLWALALAAGVVAWVQLFDANERRKAK